jgi:hypothetical protein
MSFADNTTHGCFGFFVTCIAVLFAILIGLTGCGPGAPHSGVVVDKRHEDAREWNSQECSMWGKYGCMAYYSQHHFDDEDWYLTLDDGEHSGERQVTHAQYDEATVGDNWSDGS